MTKLENKMNWTKGEIVSVPRKSTQIKSGLKSHMHFVSSRYVCIREEDAEQCGILVKVLKYDTNLSPVTSIGILS